MTARRPTRYTAEMFTPDPMAGAGDAADAAVALDLAGIMEQLQSFDQESIHGYLWRKPAVGFGKFQYIAKLSPPFEYGQLIGTTQGVYGGGDYRLQIFAGGKTRRNFEFSVEGAPKAVGEAPAGTDKDPFGNGSMSIIAMMMQQQAESRRDSEARADAARREALDQQRFMLEQQGHRNTLILGILGPLVAAIAPQIVAGGGREKLADLLAIMHANKSEQTSLKDTVETMVLVKKLFGDDKPEGFNPDDIVGSVARLAGPIAAAAGRAFNGRQVEAQPEEPAPFGDGHLHLPPPAAPEAAPALPLQDRPPASPVLALIRPHVLYFYSAGLDPNLAAEAVVDIMVRSGVDDEDLSGLVAAYTLAADWKADLAAQGLDLRANPEWADDFLADLVAAWPDRHRDGDDRAGGAGGVADAAAHAPPGAPGLPLDGDTGAGA